MARRNGVSPPRERSEEVYRAALRLFREKGYHATSMQDIAVAVGLYDVVKALVDRRISFHGYALGSFGDPMLLGALANHTGGTLAVDGEAIDAKAAGLFLSDAAHGAVLWPTAAHWPGRRAAEPGRAAWPGSLFRIWREDSARKSELSGRRPAGAWDSPASRRCESRNRSNPAPESEYRRSRRIPNWA